ncbi:kinase-like protein [Conidiobolus coronatus NRRL 28638]|uniref:non-specific serine/threonine protein kinase n=1 Tax=Conidiobolus coronatus (strain ATCC 28846 / CBS 209.66 / NRRL 28638) TaxID=796925 RepID=A0A137PJ56_CONC2|nr:kinase-like protein [Conidiobolus coronatus NRRL 28638]|eukprot:KXN75032.1 kinase-like protein [Conidiobolus coronatus NRRL 28638]
MSQLNHPNIVKFFGSETSSKVENGINMGFETLIWMEYCQEGNLVDLMNSRISTKFAEAEILYMFCDIIQGVGFMHLSSPQIVHRDLKVENVLISKERKFKLCDFGSCTTRIVPPRTQLTMQQIHSLEEDIQKNTTLQYRAPEMIDLFLRKGLTEKTDIWALGVLLYKLCYFITPFEENGQLAILNCRYDFPQSPQYSDGIKSLISSMLQEDPEDRPNIVKVCERVCQLRKVPCPLSGFENVLKDHESSQKRTIPAESRHQKSNSVTEDVFNIAQQKGPEMNINTESITPMRRGRPKKNASVQLVNSFNPNQPQSNNLKDLSSEFSNSDPFTALVQESGQKSSTSSVSNDNQNWKSNQATSSSQEFDPFSLLAQGQAASIQNTNSSDPSGTSENISTQRRLPRPPSIDNMNSQSNNYANQPPQRPPRKISNEEKIDSVYASFGSQLPRPPSGEFTKPSNPDEDLLLGSTQRRLPRRPSGDIKKQHPDSFPEPPPKPAQRTLPRAPSGEFEASAERVSFSNTESTERALPRPPSNEDLINISNRLSSNNSQHSRPKANRFDSFEHDDEEEDSLLSTGGYSNLNDEEPFASFEDNDPYSMSKLKQTLPHKSRHTSSKSLPPPIPPKPPSLSILDNLSNSPLSPTHSNKPPPIPPKPRNLQ